MKRTALLITTFLTLSSCLNAAEVHPLFVVSPDVNTLARAGNEFALSLYSRLKDSPGNIFMSPYSISTCLTLAYAGAEEQTAEQMQQVLSIPIQQSQSCDGTVQAHWHEEKFHAVLGSFIQQLNARGEQGNYQLSIANALWGQKDYGFLDGYVALLDTYYRAGLRELDFIKNTEAARQTINTWVEEKTQEKIKNLIAKGMLGKDTRLVLTNAIYFKGNWADQFRKELTREEPFKPDAGEQIRVPMMRRAGKYRYLEDENLQVLEMPYLNNELSMIALLPKPAVKLSQLEQELTVEGLRQWLAQMRKKEVQVLFPKFEMTWDKELTGILQKMGMTDAFTTRANFAGINGKRDLAISAVVHKAFIKVNEEGTEAAAATGVGMRTTSMPARPVIFRADHPFLFVIRDNLSGSILFIGRLTKPIP